MVSRRMVDGWTDPNWSEFLTALDDILDQSIAAAIRVNRGPEASAALLREGLSRASLSRRVLFAMNAPFDAISAEIQSESLALNFVDDRSHLLPPPLYHGSHHLDSVVQNLERHRFPDAIQKSWAVLRRQLALGLVAESRTTMEFFARALLAMLEDQAVNRSERGNFYLAVRLLVQSADSTSAEKIPWSKKLVTYFVDETAVRSTLEAAMRHQGAAVERKRVAIELFYSWMLKLPHDRQHVARSMIGFLAHQAEYGRVSFMRNHDLGVRAMEVLNEIANERPEFRRENLGAIFVGFDLQADARGALGYQSEESTARQ